MQATEVGLVWEELACALSLKMANVRPTANAVTSQTGTSTSEASGSTLWKDTSVDDSKPSCTAPHKQTKHSSQIYGPESTKHVLLAKLEGTRRSMGALEPEPFGQTRVTSAAQMSDLETCAAHSGHQRSVEIFRFPT